MFLKRIQMMLALLFVGSASMLADDLFPGDPEHKYQNYKRLVGKVLLNGEELTSEAVIAAYAGDELRGKKSPDDENMVWLQLWGDDHVVPIHFKVYTGGRIIEVDQGLEYSPYNDYGSYADPYLINLTTVTTNTSAEGWATTCLPFNAVVPDGVSVYTASRIEDGVLKIEPVACTILPKDTPVLLKTESKTSYEWLSRVAEGNAEIETNLFKGTTEALSVEAGSVLTLGHATDGNKAIGFWRFNGTTVPANRAYLESSVAAEVRGVTIDWDGMAAGIGEVKSERVKSERVKSEKCADTWYNLSGRKIRHASSIISHPSFVILNGKKIFMR
jgi:hypothetical protein